MLEVQHNNTNTNPCFTLHRPGKYVPLAVLECC